MVSNLKSETARANGAKSRGPTTAEGKEKSSRNAVKHGLTAGSGNILLDSEDPDEFQEIFNKLLGIHVPATPAENDLVEEMVAARWRIRRMWTITTSPRIPRTRAHRAFSDGSHSLALASRYEPRLQRTYDRAYKTLRELQQARKSETPEQPHEINIRWVDSKEELEMRAAATPPPGSTPQGSTAPSVSEGETEAPKTELRNEPT